MVIYRSYRLQTFEKFESKLYHETCCHPNINISKCDKACDLLP